MASIVRSLSFTVHVVDLTDDSREEGPGRPYRCLEARPLADGIPLHKGYVFDIAPLIGYGLRDVDTDLYTCSCGVAGCAGIHEEVELRVDAESVSWTFPEDPFRKGLAGELFPADAPLTLHFDKAQYQRALESAEAQLLALAADGGAPVVLAVASAYPDIDTPLAEVLATIRVHADKRLERDARKRELFGELLDQEVLVRFPTGALRVIPVTNFAYHLGYDEQEATGVDSEDILADKYLPDWKKDSASLITAVRGASWEFVGQVMFRTARGGAELEPLPEQWASAVFTLEREA
jgi:hypothetical protein